MEYGAKRKGKSLAKKLFKADRNSAVENNVFENNDHASAWSISWVIFSFRVWSPPFPGRGFYWQPFSFQFRKNKSRVTTFK